MNWADWAIIGILTLSTLISLVRGFIKEAFSLLIWVAALLIANMFSDRLQPSLSYFISTPSVCIMTAFVLVFLGVLLLGALINYGIAWLVKTTGLTVSDRFFGMLFGFARGLFITLVLLIYVPAFVAIKNDPWFQQSQLIPYFKPYEETVKNITGKISYWVLHLISSSDKRSV